mmetsp:Transcript_20465/g.50873  ORF Transcript_20465/g.50873 Transcript_20465/m.50873 type:complete len:217 (+) Transcript_20465:146-796(+)
MPLLGFSMGTSDGGDVGKSLDDIIADRRKEQAKAASGKSTKETGGRKAREKKTAMADRSVATGRAKRQAAARARRGLAADKKPSAMEVEKEVYRQSRKTAASKKASEKKAANGRLPPNSSLRDKKIKKATKKQLQAAIKGMELAGCPVPKGFDLFMEFSPEATKEKPKGKQPNANNNSSNKKNTNLNKKNNNSNNNNNNNNSNKKAGGGRKTGRGR